jgi:hypothetical protein
VRNPLITPLADRRTDVYAELLGYAPEAHPQPDLQRALTSDPAPARVRHG